MTLSEIDALIAANHTARRNAEADGRLSDLAVLEEEYQRLLDAWSMAYLTQRFANREPSDR